MEAGVGDEIVIRGHHVGDPTRRGVIREARGEGGQPPYVVQWSDGHEDLFIPSSDAVIAQRSAPQAERGATSFEGKQKEKLVMSREDAGRRLLDLGRALTESPDLELEISGRPVHLRVAAQVRLEVEAKSDAEETELEVELKWGSI